MSNSTDDYYSSTLAPTVESTGTWTSTDTLITISVALIAFGLIVLFVWLNNIPPEKKERSKSFASESGASDSLHSVEHIFAKTGPDGPDMQKFPLSGDEEAALLGDKKARTSKKTGEPWPPAKKP